ncbi:MAG: TolC family protein [Acidobacteriota bacterium]
MPFIRRISLTVLATALFSGSLSAQQANILTLQDAVHMALSGGTDARRARLSETRARIAEKEGLESMFPQGDLRLVQTNESINLQTFGFSIPGQPPVVGPFNVTDAQVSAAVQLFNLAALRHYQALRKGTEASVAQLQRARNDVINAVARLYVLVERADAQSSSRQSEIDLFERLTRLSRDELQAGTGTRLDVAQADLQLARSRQALLVAKNDRQSALVALLTSIGADQSSEVTLVAPLPVPGTAPSLEESLTRARNGRPELQAARLMEASAKLGVEAARDRQLPSLALDFAGDYSGNHPNELLWSRRVSGVVSMPIFRPDLRANAARARVTLEESQINREGVERGVEQQVRQASMSLENAQARMELAGGAATVAEQALQIAREKQESGYGSSVEVDRAEDSYRQAREDVIAARADAALAWYGLQYSTGTIGVLFEAGP